MASLLCCGSSRPAQPDLNLVLEPSATSFLSGTILNDKTGRPVYSINTTGNTTQLSRSSTSTAARRRYSDDDDSTLVASVTWPEHPSLRPANQPAQDTRVSVDGSTLPLFRFLSVRKSFTGERTHKFRIAGYRSTFRWKRSGTSNYTLHAASLSWPLAILHAERLTSTLRLEIYGADIPSFHSQDRQGAISTVLLDHIVLTALLLVTSPLEWRQFGNYTWNTGSVSMEEPDNFIYANSGSPCQSTDTVDSEEMRAVAWAGVTRRSTGSTTSLTAPSTSTASSRTLVQNLVRNAISHIAGLSSTTSFQTAPPQYGVEDGSKRLLSSR